MSVGSTLKHVLGIVVGILIPGTGADAANLTHIVQQKMADKLGERAADLAERLKLDTTGMSGPDKVFAIASASHASPLVLVLVLVLVSVDILAQCVQQLGDRSAAAEPVAQAG